MNILFILDHPKSSGGGHIQGINYYEIFNKICDDIPNVMQYYLNDKILSGDALDRAGATPVEIKFLKIRTKLLEILFKLFPAGMAFNIAKKSRLSIEREINKKNIDLVVYLGPSRLLPVIGNINFIISSWDLSHIEDCEFPEVRDPSTYFTRELWIKTFYRRAVCIIVDSAFSKRQMHSWYGIDPSRIIIVPFEPNPQVALKRDDKQPQVQSDTTRILVPAQFWSHKGHIWVIEAIHRLNLKGVSNLHVTFVGGDRNSRSKKIKALVDNKNLTSIIHFSGFISDVDLQSLYAKTDILLFPSYFGPTNLPPLEGVLNGLPVIMPKKQSFCDFYGNSFFYFDIEEPETLDKIILNLMGRSEPIDYNDFLQKLEVKRATGRKKLRSVLSQFSAKQKLWKI